MSFWGQSGPWSDHRRVPYPSHASPVSGRTRHLTVGTGIVMPVPRHRRPATELACSQRRRPLPTGPNGPSGGKGLLNRAGRLLPDSRAGPSAGPSLPARSGLVHAAVGLLDSARPYIKALRRCAYGCPPMHRPTTSTSWPRGQLLQSSGHRGRRRPLQCYRTSIRLLLGPRPLASGLRLSYY